MAARGWMIISGAGPGSWRPRPRAPDANTPSVSTFELPFEQFSNPYIDAETMLVAMQYFFTRKVAMTRPSNAFAIFPGGLGTMDETFEVLTLLHTGKTSPAPVGLVDMPEGTFWRRGWIRRQRGDRRPLHRRDRHVPRADLHVDRGGRAEIDHFFSNYVRFDVRGTAATSRFDGDPTRTSCANSRTSCRVSRGVEATCSRTTRRSRSLRRAQLRQPAAIDQPDQRVGLVVARAAKQHLGLLEAATHLGEPTLEFLRLVGSSARSCARTVSKIASATRLSSAPTSSASVSKDSTTEVSRTAARSRRTRRAALSCRTCRRWSWGRLDEGPTFGQPPLRDAGRQELLEFFGACGHAGSKDDATQRALLPSVVRYGDHGRFEDRGVGHQRAFEFDRTDPLPAGLDDVLRAVADRHEPFAVHRTDIAGAQPVVVEPLRSIDAEIRAGDPGPTNLELADGLAVSWQHRPVFGRDPDLDAAHDATGLDAIVDLHVRGRPRRRDRDGGQGLVSVIPQPWITSMPKRSRKASIITRRTAAPPATMPRRLERSASGLPSATRRTSFQIVGTPREIVGRSSSIILMIGSPCKNICGMINSVPAKNAV